MKTIYNSVLSEAGITEYVTPIGGHGQQLKQEKLWKPKEDTKLKRKTLKQGNIKQQQAFAHSEGQQYKFGTFRGNSSK